MGNYLFTKTSDMEEDNTSIESLEEDNTSIESLDIEEITDQNVEVPNEGEEEADDHEGEEEADGQKSEEEADDHEGEEADGQEGEEEEADGQEGEEEPNHDEEEDCEGQGVSTSDINDFFNACVNIETFTAYMKNISADDSSWLVNFLNQEMINEEGTQLGTPLTSLIDPNGFCDLDLSDDEEFTMRLAIIKYLLTYAPKYLNLDVKSSIDYGITDMTFLEAVYQLKITPGFSSNYTFFLQQIEDYLNKKLY